MHKSKVCTDIEIIDDETSCDNTVIIFAKVRKCSSTEPISDTGTFNILLSNETHNLSKICSFTLGA